MTDDELYEIAGRTKQRWMRWDVYDLHRGVTTRPTRCLSATSDGRLVEFGRLCWDGDYHSGMLFWDAQVLGMLDLQACEHGLWYTSMEMEIELD